MKSSVDAKSNAEDTIGPCGDSKEQQLRDRNVHGSKVNGSGADASQNETGSEINSRNSCKGLKNREDENEGQKDESDSSSGKALVAESTENDDDATNTDPHNLISRYVLPQAQSAEQALREIRSGAKRSCWLWFVLPTAPYIVNGVERGSSMNRYFALRTDEEVKAYLRLRPQTLKGGGGGEVNLRRNYLSMARAVEEQLSQRSNRGMLEIFGSIDAPKAISSFKLFHRISGELSDDEICDVCGRILAMVERADGTGRGTKRKQSRLLFRSKTT